MNASNIANLTTVNNNSNQVTEILARLDAQRQKPVIFFPHTIDNDQILAWSDGKEAIEPIAYYHSTLPLSAADERAMADRYSLITGDKHVRIRHRLPRVYKERANVVAIITQTQPVQQPVQQPTAAPEATPKPQPTVTRRRVRSGHAKPIESQPLPATQNAPAHTGYAIPDTVSTATPADVMHAIRALGEEFNEKLNDLMEALTPQH